MDLYNQVIGINYRDTTLKNNTYEAYSRDTKITDKGTKIVKNSNVQNDEYINESIIADSIAFCAAAREEGYLILWDPQIEKKLK